MNAVIARLVSRALPQPGGVQPRLGSRFGHEASPAEAASPAHAEPEAGSPAQHAGARVEQPRPAAMLPHEAAVVGQSPAAVSSRPSHYSDGQPPGQPSPAPSAVFPSHATGASNDTTPAVDGPFDAGLPLSEPGEPPREVRAAPELVPRRSRGRPLPAQDLSVATESLAPLLPATTVVTVPATSHAAPERSGSRDDAEPQQPDIHISIGRIEVRAAQPERRPVPARPPRPQLMSLEDYLAKGRTRQ